MVDLCLLHGICLCLWHGMSLSFFDKPDGRTESYVQLTCLAFYFIVTLRFCILSLCLCVSVSLFLSVLVFFLDKPDGGTESDVQLTY